MSQENSKRASQTPRVTWVMFKKALFRPYPVTLPMILLVSLVPVYIFIAEWIKGVPTSAPEWVWDQWIPLVPSWSLVYGALYFFLIVLPVFIIQQPELIRRTVWAYLAVWLFAYICFLLYPTHAPRPEVVTGSGFAVWGLKFLYGADPAYNCFPSLHVAHSFVSALACFRVHRLLGWVSLLIASLVALSTLFIKQHYVADVLAGALLAFIAYLLFLRSYPRSNITDQEHQLVPALSAFVCAIVGFVYGVFWILYLFNVQPK